MTVDRQQGTTAELHALDPEALLAGRASAIVLMLPTDRALVLGSSQADDVVDRAAAEAAGFAVARRRSGGGVVATGVADAVWIDVLLAPRHPRWRMDVDLAAVEVGLAWADVLRPHVAGHLEVHRGPLLHRDAGKVACFGGLGSGEVTLDGAKLVGLSQRRARWGARFQCQVQLRWAPDEWRHALRPGPDAPSELFPLPVATLPPGPGLDAALAAGLESHLDAHLDRHLDPHLDRPD